MLLRLRFPYRAPRELLQVLQAATKLSKPFTPGVPSGQRSTSIRWSAVVACRLLHQWHSGLSFSSSCLFVLNSVLLLAWAFRLRLWFWSVLCVLRFLPCVIFSRALRLVLARADALAFGLCCLTGL